MAFWVEQVGSDDGGSKHNPEQLGAEGHYASHSTWLLCVFTCLLPSPAWKGGTATSLSVPRERHTNNALSLLYLVIIVLISPFAVDGQPLNPKLR